MPQVHGLLMGILSILAGILVIWMPAILPLIIGIFLIVIGAIAILAVFKNKKQTDLPPTVVPPAR